MDHSLQFLLNQTYCCCYSLYMYYYYTLSIKFQKSRWTVRMSWLYKCVYESPLTKILNKFVSSTYHMPICHAWCMKHADRRRTWCVYIAWLFAMGLTCTCTVAAPQLLSSPSFVANWQLLIINYKEWETEKRERETKSIVENINDVVLRYFTK